MTSDRLKQLKELQKEIHKVNKDIEQLQTVKELIGNRSIFAIDETTVEKGRYSPYEHAKILIGLSTTNSKKILDLYVARKEKELNSKKEELLKNYLQG